MATTAQRDEATAVADTLKVATRDYLQLWADLAHQPLDEEDARETCAILRAGGIQLAEALAYANRLASDGKAVFRGNEIPIPSCVVQALRNLEDSYILLATIRDYGDLAHLPLVPEDDLRQTLSDPTCGAWMSKVSP